MSAQEPEPSTPTSERRTSTAFKEGSTEPFNCDSPLASQQAPTMDLEAPRLVLLVPQSLLRGSRASSVPAPDTVADTVQDAPSPDSLTGSANPRSLRAGVAASQALEQEHVPASQSEAVDSRSFRVPVYNPMAASPAIAKPAIAKARRILATQWSNCSADSAGSRVTQASCWGSRSPAPSLLPDGLVRLEGKDVQEVLRNQLNSSWPLPITVTGAPSLKRDWGDNERCLVGHFRVWGVPIEMEAPVSHIRLFAPTNWRAQMEQYQGDEAHAKALSIQCTTPVPRPPFARPDSIETVGSSPNTPASAGRPPWSTQAEAGTSPDSMAKRLRTDMHSATPTPFPSPSEGEGLEQPAPEQGDESDTAADAPAA